MSEKRRRATAAEIRGRAFHDVIEWLEYRAAICRDGLERHAAARGADSRAVADERAAAFEAELILREIGRLARQPPRSRAFRQAAEARRRFVAEQRERAGGATEPSMPDLPPSSCRLLQSETTAAASTPEAGSEGDRSGDPRTAGHGPRPKTMPHQRRNRLDKPKQI